LFCKRCGAREDVFLSAGEYQIQEKLIHQEVGNV
jgi:hypothetical protein